MGRPGPRRGGRGTVLGVRGEELFDLARLRDRDARAQRRGAHARGPHVRLRRLLHGRLPRHPARERRGGERRAGQRARRGLHARRQHGPRQQRRGGALRRRPHAAGAPHRLALPAERRRAHVHAALPAARRRDRARRRGRGRPAGLGEPVGIRPSQPARERPRLRRAARHARVDRARLARASPERARR